MHRSVAARLEVLAQELAMGKQLVKEAQLATTRAAKRVARLRRTGARRWWAGMVGNREQRIATATLDHEVCADDLRTAERQLELFNYENEVLLKQRAAAKTGHVALRHLLREEDGCLAGTEFAELQTVLRQINQKESLLREIDEAVDHAGTLRKRINAASKYLTTHVRYRSQRTKGRQRAKVAFMSDERMARFQQLLVTVHKAHGRFEAELRDVYELQLRCRTRADQQVEETLGAYRRYLTPQVQPDYLRNNRLDRQLNTLKSTVLGLSRSLRGDKQQLHRELTRLEAAEVAAWQDVA